MTKPSYTSKTIIFNVLAIVVLVASQFGYVGDISPEIEGYVNALMPLVVLVVNILLRFATKQPISIK